jgi:hypothetical protein
MKSYSFYVRMYVRMYVQCTENILIVLQQDDSCKLDIIHSVEINIKK